MRPTFQRSRAALRINVRKKLRRVGCEAPSRSSRMTTSGDLNAISFNSSDPGELQEGGVRGAVTDDAIQLKIDDLWAKNDFAMFRKLNVTVKEGRVLLTGSVPNPDMRVEAVRLADLDVCRGRGAIRGSGRGRSSRWSRGVGNVGGRNGRGAGCNHKVATIHALSP